MSDRDPLRDAARYRVERLAAAPAAGAGSAGEAERPEKGAGRGAPDGSAVPASDAPAPGGPPRGAGRMDRRGGWVDEIVRQAMARGEFDDLPLAGKPIPGLTRHDPDWWLKALVERERITGVLPEALQLRTDDAALDERLDRERTEERVRELLAEFNARVVAARRQLLGGPPVVTPTRDVDAEVERWRARAGRGAPARAERDVAAAHGERARDDGEPVPPRRRWPLRRPWRGSPAGGSSGGRGAGTGPR